MTEDTNMLYKPMSVAHPGETVVDYLEFNGWSQRDLARRTGLTPKTISEICNGKAPITPSTSLALEKVLRRPAHFWLNLQRQYDEAEARRRAQPKLSEWQSWADQFPLAEMKRYNWIEIGRQDLSKVDALLKFFGVSSPESWHSVWEASNIAFRQTRKFATSIEAISAWIRATELEAAQLETKDFDENRLRSLLNDLRCQTREPAEKFVPKVQDLCGSAGIAVVWVPELPHTGISGCARWLSDRKALIGLTLRYKTDDQIWFTFFHEVAHILLHRKEHGFILDNADEDLTDKVIDPQMQKNEEQASRFAADTLIPPEILSSFIKKQDFSNEAVHRVSDDLGIGPGIVIGRLQREGLLAYHQGNTLKRIFNWNFRSTSI
jgi:HTH-type transcriptional regulator/antitoxin HigA